MTKMQHSLEISKFDPSKCKMGIPYLFHRYTVTENLTFQDFSNINALGIKFGIAVKKVKVNPDSSFVQI